MAVVELVMDKIHLSVDVSNTHIDAQTSFDWFDAERPSLSLALTLRFGDLFLSCKTYGAIEPEHALVVHIPTFTAQQYVNAPLSVAPRVCAISGIRVIKLACGARHDL